VHAAAVEIEVVGADLTRKLGPVLAPVAASGGPHRFFPGGAPGLARLGGQVDVCEADQLFAAVITSVARAEFSMSRLSSA